MPFRDDPSAPNVSARFGEQIRGNSEANDNVFDLNRGGGRQPNNTPRGGISSSAPPREITQQWFTADDGEQGAPQHTIEATGATTYSGMAAATKKGGLGTQANIIQDLLWQRSVGGDTAKITQWKEIMGNLQDFKAYLFVKQGSSFATVMHSPMKFAAISAATGHLQGRIIGFVGDRTPTREPTPILLPQRKTWEWVKETVSSDGPAMFKFYDDDPSRASTLWKGEGGDDGAKEEVHAPRLLSIPL